jgi:predicted dehydrogenase
MGRSGLIDAAAGEAQVVADHQLHFGYRVRGLERTPLDLAAPAHTVRLALEAFADLLTDGREPPTSLLDGVRAVQIAEACRRSGESGLAVEVDPTTP